MICNTCGVKNNDGNKFCTNCGEELTWEDLSRTGGIEGEANVFAEESINNNECPECGTRNADENKYCISCGHQLKQGFLPGKEKHSKEAKAEKQNKQKNRNPYHQNKKQYRRELNHKHIDRRKQISRFGNFKYFKVLWIIAGVIIGSILIVTSFDLIFHKYPDEKQIPSEFKSSNPAIEAKVYEIASKFVCSCGTCNEESLEVCKCERAVEERQFVRDYLEQNQKSDDIIVALANKYGWMKVEFASDFKIDASKIWNPNQLQIKKDIISTTPDLTNTKAGISDKYTIYSAFTCPCGQCNKDELRDCSCTHSNGAIEIKKFIDEKISENKYTINEIIGFVDKKYGGRKI